MSVFTMTGARVFLCMLLFTALMQGWQGTAAECHFADHRGGLVR